MHPDEFLSFVKALHDMGATHVEVRGNDFLVRFDSAQAPRLQAVQLPRPRHPTEPAPDDGADVSSRAQWRDEVRQVLGNG